VTIQVRSQKVKLKLKVTGLCEAEAQHVDSKQLYDLL